MFYTVRFAHLESKPDLSVGSLVTPNMCIGKMGNTGYSTAAHVHIDIVQGWKFKPYKLQDIPAHEECVKQMMYFLCDDKMFGCRPRITTYYGDPNYMQPWRFHPGYDFVPVVKNEEYYYLHWNRSMSGEVAFNGEYGGYGNVIHVAYEV